MANSKSRTFDVFLVEMDTAYQDVPFSVVADWLQQGRLLGEDKIRPSGGTTWYLIAKVPKLAAYLPKPDPIQMSDEAEALEPVELGLEWPSSFADDDQDVDMVPLIDVSLVLLIFFMMAASVSSGIMSPIKTPGATNQLSAISKDMFWVGLNPRGPDGVVKKTDDGKPVVWYSVGLHDAPFMLDKKQDIQAVLSFDKIESELKRRLADRQGAVKMRIRADKSLYIETIRRTIRDLQSLQHDINAERNKTKRERITFEILGEVGEP